MPVLNLKLIKKHEVANGTMGFHFEKPVGFEFRAGQFADYTLINPPETDEEGNTRGFSLVHAPFEPDIVFATRMRDTAFKRVMKDLPLGSEIKFDGPYGDFTLHKTESTPAVFLIGGIGITPVRSMIAQATHDKTAHKLTLLYSNKTPADAAFTNHFEQFASDNPNFTFVPVYTDVAEDEWSGERGYIDADMVRRYASDLTAPIFYLSGPAAMVGAMRKMLIEAGVNEDNIKTEEFSGY